MKSFWVISSLIFVLVSNASAGNLTLPFSNSSTPLWQGWYYNNGGYHGGIDYGCGCGTDILASHSGYATSWYQPYNPNNPNDYSYGQYVLMFDPATGLYTLYAHLSSWSSKIPRVKKYHYDGKGWVWLSRGSKIGKAGNTGTQVCHLHFELTSGGYATGRLDPYGLYKTSGYYPGCGNNSGSYAFTSCPPRPPSTGSTCNNPGSYVDIITPGDFNGDGKQEFARFYKAAGRWDVALSSGFDFTPLMKWKCLLGRKSTWQGVGDVNGDGKDDAVVHYEANGIFYIALSEGNKFGTTYVGSTIPMMRGYDNKFMADVNGDGRDDLIGFTKSDGKWRVSLSNGHTYNSNQVVIAGHGIGSAKRLVGDVNGDGRADALTFYASSGRWNVAFGAPNGTFGTKLYRWADRHSARSHNQFLADINADGKLDAVSWWNYVASNWKGVLIAWHSDGKRFLKENRKRAFDRGTWSKKQMFGDFNGDRIADFAYWYPTTGWWVVRGKGWSFHLPERW